MLLTLGAHRRSLRKIRFQYTKDLVHKKELPEYGVRKICRPCSSKAVPAAIYSIDRAWDNETLNVFRENEQSVSEEEYIFPIQRTLLSTKSCTPVRIIADESDAVADCGSPRRDL
jgi:hypothetical protein